ncbi:NADP-dependent oxidoreductase domain-containing protein [Mycena galopus ATCC 62051]|nr:NADP-dependent oxidoreductase domain-containing protein [Mycena galopus ATCC 62051]
MRYDGPRETTIVLCGVVVSTKSKGPGKVYNIKPPESAPRAVLGGNRAFLIHTLWYLMASVVRSRIPDSFFQTTNNVYLVVRAAYSCDLWQGAGGIGAPGTFCKLTDVAAAQPILDAWCKRAGPSAIDTSNLYGFGTSEKILGEMDLHGSFVDTKFYPLAPGDHSAVKIKVACARSIEALEGVRIRVLYLHAPDRATPWSETLQALDELHKEGKFETFGLSNFKTYEVAEIVTLCRANGWISPTVYEGIYSAIDRTVETELIPCLRHFGIKFTAYSPLAGGYLVGHLLSPDTNGTGARPATSRHPGAVAAIPRGSHFDSTNPFGMWYQDRYLRMGPAVRELRAVVEAHGMNLNAASVRWLQHHSALRPTDHGIIFGGSKVSHVEDTLRYCTEGPLPEPVVAAYEECYAKVKGGLSNYHQDPAWYNPEVYGY